MRIQTSLSDIFISSGTKYILCITNLNLELLIWLPEGGSDHRERFNGYWLHYVLNIQCKGDWMTWEVLCRNYRKIKTGFGLQVYQTYNVLIHISSSNICHTKLTRHCCRSDLQSDRNQMWHIATLSFSSFYNEPLLFVQHKEVIEQKPYCI